MAWGRAICRASKRAQFLEDSIKGRFADYIIWPADSKLASIVGGLVLRAKVTVNGKSVTLSYRVKPR